jgi:hypothetical protein
LWTTGLAGLAGTLRLDRAAEPTFPMFLVGLVRLAGVPGLSGLLRLGRAAEPTFPVGLQGPPLAILRLGGTTDP